MSTAVWQPSADIATLRERAAIIRRIREFFYEREVMEVETPTLSAASVTDVHLASFRNIYQRSCKFNGI